MQPTVGQMLYPDCQAFFAKLSLSLSLQPAIKTGPAPLPSGQRRRGSGKYAKGGANGGAEHCATKHEVESMIKGCSASLNEARYQMRASENVIPTKTRVLPTRVLGPRRVRSAK